MSDSVGAARAAKQDDSAAHDAIPYDPVANRIGMWLFLFTEFVLFGTLFIAYGVYLHEYRWQFQEGSANLNIWAGAINTLVLLTSSLTVALSIAALERSKARLSAAMLSVTVLLSESGSSLKKPIIRDFLPGSVSEPAMNMNVWVSGS